MDSLEISFAHIILAFQSSVKLSEFKPPQGKFAIFFAYLHKSVFLQVAAVYILTIPYPPDPKVGL